MGVDCELRPVPRSIARQWPALSRRGSADAEAGDRLEELPQRLCDSPAAQELRCLLDTQATAPATWDERLKVAIADTFRARPDLAKTALHGLELAMSQLQTGDAAKRDVALGELDALLFGLCLARASRGAQRP